MQKEPVVLKPEKSLSAEVKKRRRFAICVGEQKGSAKLEASVDPRRINRLNPFYMAPRKNSDAESGEEQSSSQRSTQNSWMRCMKELPPLFSGYSDLSVEMEKEIFSYLPYRDLMRAKVLSKTAAIVAESVDLDKDKTTEKEKQWDAEACKHKLLPEYSTPRMLAIFQKSRAWTAKDIFYHYPWARRDTVLFKSRAKDRPIFYREYDHKLKDIDKRTFYFVGALYDPTKKLDTMLQQFKRYSEDKLWFGANVLCFATLEDAKAYQRGDRRRFGETIMYKIKMRKGTIATVAAPVVHSVPILFPKPPYVEALKVFPSDIVDIEYVDKSLYVEQRYSTKLAIKSLETFSHHMGDFLSRTTEAELGDRNRHVRHRDYDFKYFDNLTTGPG